MRKNSVKNRRINDEVMRELTQIIRTIKDPRVSPMTSVMHVDVAGDLKTCKIRISVMGSEEDQQNTLKGLQSAKGYIRSELARTINLRNTPELTFILDNSIEYGVTMGHRIDEIIADDLASEADREARGIDINDMSAYVSDEEEDDIDHE